MRIFLTVALVLALGACSAAPSSDVIKALGSDTASNCIGGSYSGLFGGYGARANDPDVNIEVGPTGCKITHNSGGGTTVILPGTAGPKPLVITPNGKVVQ